MLLKLRTGSITTKRGAGKVASVCTTIRNGCLFSDPRQAVPPLRSPPRQVSSIYKKPVSLRMASRSAMTCMILCFIRQALL